MDEYFIALIIVTIVTFIISIVLSLYFVYIPVQRISRKLDDEVRQGIQVLDKATSVAKDVEDTGKILSSFLTDFCEGIEDKRNFGILFNLLRDKGSFDQSCQLIESCP